MVRILFQGLLTGLVLQAAIGPIFIYVVNIALQYGTGTGLAAAAAVTCADYTYIILAILGIGKLLERPGMNRILTRVSAVVLILFGTGMLRSVWGDASLIQATGGTAMGVFATTLLLTLSSPLTIVFWSGIFASRALALGLDRKELTLFGVGAGMSTLLFMSTAVIILSRLRAVVPSSLMQWGNGLVGLALIIYGIVRLIKSTRRDNMRILVLGSGGREHAIVWRLANSPSVEQIYAIPGNPGIAELAQCEPIAMSDQEAIAAFAKKEAIDLVVVGPEQPLVDGIADRLRADGIRVFGPGQAGAQLEGSKIFSKEFMVRHDILTSGFKVFEDKDSAIAGLEGFSYPLVIKVDGLAAGKGVLIPKTREQAIADLETIFDDRQFGDAGDRVLIEEFVTGFEASILCLVDNDHIIPLESARDYKKALDGDEGLNTGGMGTISPNDKLMDGMMDTVETDVLQKTLQGLKADGLDFNGVLFIGLMITDAGEPYVLEYNVRFGDPETQSVLPRLKNDLGEIFAMTTDNRLGDVSLEWDPRTAVTVILASGGYPGDYEKGKPISFAQKDEVMVFHAGTKEQNGAIVTNGGRVLGITALADDKHQARETIYRNIEKIDFDGKMFRTDIGM